MRPWSEVALLSKGAASLMVDYAACEGTGIMATLAAIAGGPAGKALNLRVVDGDALAALLPRILPSEWRGKQRGGGAGKAVEWKPEGTEGHPTAETLALLWSRFAAVSPDSLSR